MAGILGSILGGYALDKIGGAIGLSQGGQIQKTGLYKLHKGELVVPARVNKKVAPPAKQTSIKAVVKKVKAGKPAGKATKVGGAKKPRTAAQKAATARMVAANKARREGKPKGWYADPKNVKNLPAPPKTKIPQATQAPKAPPARTKRGSGVYVKSCKYKGVAAKRKAKKEGN